MARSKSSATPSEAKPATEQAQQDQVTIVGRFTADPIVRQTKSGKKVANFSVAVNPPAGDAVFHRVVAWQAGADLVARYPRKGQPVHVTGRTQERPWIDKDGKAQISTEIVAKRITFPTGAEFDAAKELS